jgi:arginine N-succinyltransferase
MSLKPPVNNAKTDDPLRPEDLLIRPSAPYDLNDFCELARLAGAGFTSLPADEALLAERLRLSERAFAGEPGILTLALEDRRFGKVVGCAAVKPGGAPRADFLNLRITPDGRSLAPSALYADLTEVGSLLLRPDYRMAGVGRWLACSRYLMIAADLDRFGVRIFSELRGVVGDDDRSPFYDSVCAPLFGRSFADADDLCARGRQAELNALLPTSPIPLARLSREARRSMGRPHRAGARALDFLKEEGFRFEGVIDLLDGGPIVVARSRAVKTIRTAIAAPIVAGAVDSRRAGDVYLAVGGGPDYRCCRAPVIGRDGAFVCEPAVLAMLSAEDGAIARVAPANKRTAASFIGLAPGPALADRSPMDATFDAAAD